MRTALTIALVPLILIALSATASAQVVCEDDGDCSAGFRCEEVGVMGCDSPACPPGEECPDVFPCEEEPFRMCVPGPCDSDSDCAPGLLCLAVVYDDCGSIPPCDPDEGPCELLPGDCTEETLGYCLPPYLTPCERDADCGPGFTCEQSEICRCSGSGPGDDPEPDCTCEPGERFCQVVPIACEDDAACPDEWSCEMVGGSGTCWFDPESGEGGCEEEPDGEQLCVPPYFLEVDGGGAGGGGPLDAATGGAESRVTGEFERPAVSTSRTGCSAAPGPVGAGLPIFVLAALGLLVTRRRG